MTARRTSPIIAVVVVVLLILVGAYMGAYYSMLSGRGVRMSDGFIWPLDPPTGSYVPVGGTCTPIYRVRGQAVPIIFEPAYQVDRLVRPTYWGN